MIEEMRLLPPVGQCEGIAELLDTSEMSGVAGDKFEALLDSNSGDHWVGQAYVLARAVQVAGNPACQFGGRLIEYDDLLESDCIQEIEQAAGVLHAVEALDDFHHCDDGHSVYAMLLAVQGGILGNGWVFGFEDFGIDVRVEQGLIHLATLSTAADGAAWHVPPLRRAPRRHRSWHQATLAS